MPETEVQLWNLTQWGMVNQERLIADIVRLIQLYPSSFLKCSKHQTTETNFLVTNDEDGPEILRLDETLYDFREPNANQIFDRVLYDYTLHLLEARSIIKVTPQELAEYISKFQNRTEGANKLLEDKLTQNSKDLATFKTEKGRLAIYYPPRIADVALEYSHLTYNDVTERLLLKSFGLGIDKRGRIR